MNRTPDYESRREKVRCAEEELAAAERSFAEALVDYLRALDERWPDRRVRRVSRARGWRSPAA
jgi:hypothetical protein